MPFNEPAKLFIEQMKKMHTVSRLPFCLLDDAFELIWCNDAAREAYPPLTLPDGVKMMLEGYDPRDIRDEIASEGRFCAAGTPDNLFSGHGLLLYAAPPDCGELYVMQPRELSDDGAGLTPQGLTRSIAAFESRYRSPLATIFSSLSLLKQRMERENSQDPALAEYIRRIGQSSMELMRASQMVADYTRLSNGLYPHRPRMLDLFGYLRTLCTLTAGLLQSGEIEFSWEIPHGSLFSVTETEPLYYIFCQLVSNACRFTRPGNHISITVRSEEDRVLVFFTDRGCGMPPDRAEHIFEPYYSYGPDGAPFPGTGLGLAIARECAAFLGGELSFTTSEGRGTSFRLSLPLRDEEDAGPLLVRSPEDDQELLSAIRVLLADCIPSENP